MALQVPNLDDRKFQDIVREARSKIPLYCPKWTDYNLSDPGVTLIELFAWMTEMLLYRLNRVPDKNYIKFMELIGVHLEPPKPAMANVTFRLSAPQPEAVTIPRGTEVATIRTETQEAISFTTNRDLTILVPTLAYAFTTPDDAKFTDCMSVLKNPDIQVTIFQEVPQENNAFYLGYKENLSGQTLALTIESNIEGIGVDPRDPPRAWEYWDGEQEKWLAARLGLDTTGGLNTNGQIILHIPYTSAIRQVNGQTACWVRCRATKTRPTQRPYASSPKVRTVVSESIGGTVPASHAFRVIGELLGRSDGMPGQRFYLQNTPVLPREAGETLEIETENEGVFEAWQEVKDFSHSGPSDRHFTCDSVSGEVQLAPSIRQPTGEERRYGVIPPTGRQVRFTLYRCGGSVVGNVGEGTITVLKSSIPYIASVNNFEPARGGTDAETLDRAKMRAPHLIRDGLRAVTAEDFERLALEASPIVARARCATQGAIPGVVHLLLIPRITDGDTPIPNEALELTKRLRDEVQAYLDERRLLGTRLELTPPEYAPVTIRARVRVRAGSDPAQVATQVERRLYHYINPVTGGPTNDGWPFGRGLFLSEVYAIVQGTPNIDYIEELSIFPVDPKTGERQEATSKVSISPDSLFCSYKHEIIAE
jgi:predicted phage baseplate assembly protein